MKDVDLEITLDSASDGDKEDKQRVKEYLRKGGGAQEIRRRLQEYVDSLKHEYSQGKSPPHTDSRFVLCLANSVRVVSY